MKDERFEEIRHDYQTIPIPAELRERVTAAMEEAKTELASSASGKCNSASLIGGQKRRGVFSWRKFLLRTAGVAAAAMLAITIMANSSESIAYAMSNVPILKSIVRIVTFREYNHSNEEMEANLKIPTVSIEDENGQPVENATAQLNHQIEDYTNQIIEAYQNDVKASGGEGAQSVSLDYEVVTDNDRLFTLRFNQSIVMASGTELVKIYNLDKTTGNLLKLEDLFQEGSDYITAISDSIKSQMKSQMAADESVSYFYQTDVPETDFSQITGEENFYISDSGKLTLVFDEYTVAPGYMGVVEFEIPTEAIQGIAADGFVK
ncbi:MAG: DUF3298 domain-containing protein [Lachnospiraceae bacterium]|nr:DUF3298 domain-containing protein [Lachnospiraceae bacterium]